MLDAFLKEQLADLDRKNLRRSLRCVDGAQDRTIVMGGKAYLNFCSNNYLGLAADPRLKEAAVSALTRSGFGSGASRLVCGTLSEHRELEERLAAFKGTESCLIFNCGYMANVGIISSLFGRGDLILCDRLNHASILDGIVLSRASFRRYPHRDMQALERLLQRSGGCKKKVIITESVFSMDGDVAPLDEIIRLAREYGVVVMVDDAHGTGVLGEKGKGAAEHFNCSQDVDIQMGTLSKALGSFGAYCCGSKCLMDFLINKARSFVYTTALPPAVAAASLKALDILETEPERRKTLWKNTRFVLESLQNLGFDTMHSRTPIIPVLIKEEERALTFSRRLFEQGILVSAIRPPTVPARTARLRLTVTARHSQEDCECLIQKMQKIGRDLCLI